MKGLHVVESPMDNVHTLFWEKHQKVTCNLCFYYKN